MHTFTYKIKVNRSSINRYLNFHAISAKIILVTDYKLYIGANKNYI